MYYSWRFLLEVRGQSSLTVSAEYTPALICGLLAAGTTGFMLTHTPVSFVIMISMVAFFVGNLIGAFQPVHQVYWAQMFLSIVSIRSAPVIAVLPDHKCCTSMANHTELTIAFIAHNALRHGHEFPSKHDRALQPDATRAPRPCRLTSEHDRQLFHLHCSRNCWHRRSLR